MLLKSKIIEFKIYNSQVLWNVYREFYDIPKDLYVRKADPLMRLAVMNSEAI